MNQLLVRQVEITRANFEANRIPHQQLAELYSRYNPNVEINSFLGEAARLFPKLNCGLTSVYLHHVLGKGKIINGSYARRNHTFLSLGNTIIDITADQFGGPKIYIGPLIAPWSAKPVQQASRQFVDQVHPSFS